MPKFVICLKGYGEGCDYTIGCNFRFYEHNASSLEDLIEKLHIDFGGESSRPYMSGFEKYPEHVYESVYVVPGRLIDISDKLRDKIKEMLEEQNQQEQKTNEDVELALYEKLKKKYA